MKITSKLATAVAILGMGLGGAASVNQTQNQPKEVQAAAKRNTKLIKYKRPHIVLTTGEALNNHDGHLSAGDGLYNYLIGVGYKYVNGQKYLNTLESGLIATSNTTALKIYHATARVKLSGLYFSDNGGNPDIDADRPHNAQELDKEANETGSTYWVNPGTGKNSTIAVLTNHVYNFYGEKYYAATCVTDGMAHYIKAKDMNKLAKGGTVKGTLLGYNKAQIKSYFHRIGGDPYMKQFGYNPKKAIVGGISMK